MTPSEFRDEMGFKELCNISTQIDLPPRTSIVSAAERLTAIDKQRAVNEERQILSSSNLGQTWEDARDVRNGRLTYSLFCQANCHHNCHSQICGCTCHAEKANGINREKSTTRTLDRITPPALAERISDPYWRGRLGAAVGTTNIASVGWRGRSDDPSLAISERGESSNEGTEETVSSSLTVYHTAGEPLGEKVDQAINMLERLKKDGREASGEARRLARFLSFSGVEAGESNWQSATRAQRLAQGASEVAQIIAPSRIQTCPFPSSREIIVVDDTGNSCRAYVPEEEL